VLAKRNVSLGGPAGFVVRLVTLGVVLVVALRVVGVDPRTLAAGGAITAIVLGLAAQQTLGNLFAGAVLLSARPFRVSDRIRLQAGAIAGQIEGIVTEQGLLYTTLTTDNERVLIPNSVVLNTAVVPIREPMGVDLRVRLTPSTTPTQVQRALESALEAPTRGRPDITIEEMECDAVVARVRITPATPDDGARVADEALQALRELTAKPSGSSQDAPVAPASSGPSATMPGR
jgi:small conductance mechanosensitive channel